MESNVISFLHKSHGRIYTDHIANLYGFNYLKAISLIKVLNGTSKGTLQGSKNHESMHLLTLYPPEPTGKPSRDPGTGLIPRDDMPYFHY
jgi:hypothetical protein